MSRMKLLSKGFIGPQSLLIIGGLLLASLFAQINIISYQKPDLTIFVRQTDLNRIEGRITKKFDIEITNLGSKTAQQFDVSVDWQEGRGVETLYYLKGLDTQKTVKRSISKTYTSEKAANIMFYVDYKNKIDESNEDNNWQEVSIKVAFLPDLIISGFRWLRYNPYDQLLASVTIKNIGKGSIEIPADYDFLHGCLSSPKDPNWKKRGQDYCSLLKLKQAIALKSGEEYTVKEFRFVGVPLPRITYAGEMQIWLPNIISEVSKANNKRKIAVLIPSWGKNNGLPDLEITSVRFLDNKKAEITFKNSGKHRTFDQPIALYGHVVKTVNLQIPEATKIVQAVSDQSCCILPGESRVIIASDPVEVSQANKNDEISTGDFIEGEEWQFFIDSGYDQTESNENNNSQLAKVKFDSGEPVLSINLSPNSPPSKTILIGSENVEVARFNLSALRENLTVKDIIMESPTGGCSFTNLKLFSEGRQIGSTVPSAIAGPGITCHAEFDNLSLVIPKDTSVTIALSLSIPTTAQDGDSFAFAFGGIIIDFPASGKRATIIGIGTKAWPMRISGPRQVDLSILDVELVKSRAFEKFEAKILVGNLGPDPIDAESVRITAKMIINNSPVTSNFLIKFPPNGQIRGGEGAYYTLISNEIISPNYANMLANIEFNVFDESAIIKEINLGNNVFRTNVFIDPYITRPPTGELPDLTIKDVSFFQATSTLNFSSQGQLPYPLYGAKVTVKNIGNNNVCNQVPTIELRVSNTSSVNNSIFNPYSIGFSCKLIDTQNSEAIVTLPVVDKAEYYFTHQGTYLFVVDPYGYLYEASDVNNSFVSNFNF